ncbi:hypothetical protein [Streptomyces sp. NPDC054940]
MASSITGAAKGGVEGAIKGFLGQTDGKPAFTGTVFLKNVGTGKYLNAVPGASHGYGASNDWYPTTNDENRLKCAQWAVGADGASFSLKNQASDKSILIAYPGTESQLKLSGSAPSDKSHLFVAKRDSGSDTYVLVHSSGRFLMDQQGDNELISLALTWMDKSHKASQYVWQAIKV